MSVAFYVVKGKASPELLRWWLCSVLDDQILRPMK